MTAFDPSSEPAKLPSLPSLDGITDQNTKKFLQAVKEQIEIRFGQRPKVGKLDHALTLRDLYSYGVVSFTVNGQEIVNTNPDNTVNTPSTPSTGSNTGDDDLTIPGVPAGLIATGTKLSVLLEWDASITPVAYAEIWRSSENNLSTALMVGATEASIYPDIINEAGVTYYYWLRFVNRGGIPGQFNDDVGTQATTGQIGSAEILSLDGAKIIDATILNAKISSVSADKITTGVLNATESISVGTSTERIHITGSGKIRSGGAVDFMNGSGFYFDNPLGMGRAFIGNGTYFVAWNGSQLSIEANNFSLTPDSFIFNGSGTFAGALNAATGTFAGSLQAATGTFSGELLAATGTFGGLLMAGVLDLSQLDGFIQNYTTPGTYQFTVPADKTELRVSVAGGAAGGGNGGNYFYASSPPPAQGIPGTYYSNGGGAGGGGGSVNPTVSTIPVIPGEIYTIVVGAGGGATQPGQASSISGSTIGSIVSEGASPGQNGGNANISAVGAGGAGGSSVGGASNGSNGQNGTGTANGTSGGRATGGNPGAGVVLGGIGGSGGIPFTGGAAGSGGQNGYVLLEVFNPNAVVLQTTYNTLISALQRQGLQTQ